MTIREIKFRGKRVDNGKWVYGYVWRNLGGAFIQSHEGKVYGGIHEVHSETIGQFTGSVDRHGVDIYENSIFKRYFEIGHTVFDEGTLVAIDYEIEESGYYIGVVNYRPSEGFVLNRCKKFNEDGELQSQRSGVKLYAKYGEVIGDIYDNGNLLLHEEKTA